MGALRRKGSAALELLLGLRRVTQHPLAGERLCHIQLRRKDCAALELFALPCDYSAYAELRNIRWLASDCAIFSCGAKAAKLRMVSRSSWNV
jgi:hypothetical protein